jgi:hypothetical protein
MDGREGRGFTGRGCLGMFGDAIEGTLLMGCGVARMLRRCDVPIIHVRSPEFPDEACLFHAYCDRLERLSAVSARVSVFIVHYAKCIFLLLTLTNYRLATSV